MKFIIIALCIAVISAAPTQISDNNVGDLISVKVNADLNLSNDINTSQFTFKAAFADLLAIIIGNPGNDGPTPYRPSPEMLDVLKNSLTQK